MDSVAVAGPASIVPVSNRIGSSVGDGVTPVVWAKAGEARGTRIALVPSAPPTVDGAEAASQSPSPSDSAAVVAKSDPAQLMVTLQTERLAANGGFGHPHTGNGCAFCRRA